jgi:predicted nucleic-acid-binding protein
VIGLDTNVLMRLLTAEAPCQYTASFDKTVRGLPGMRVL